MLFPPLIGFPIVLISKGHNIFQKVYHFFFLSGSLVINRISKKTMHSYYMTLDNTFQKVMAAKGLYIIIKCNINISSVTFLWHRKYNDSSDHFWRACFYIERSWSFKLSTLYFIFNLFTKAFYSVFQSFLTYNSKHYLDNLWHLYP